MNTAEPPQDSLWGLLILCAVLILLSIIFSASETAFLSINKLRLRFLRNKKDKRAVRAGKLLDKKNLLLNTLLIGNNIVNISLSAVVTSIALSLIGNSGIGIATVVVTITLLVFGEITPKTIGAHHPEAIAFFFSSVIRFFSIILRPLVLFFTGFSSLILLIFKIKTPEKSVSFTEEEIKHLIEIGEEEGILDSSEKKMMHKVFKFTDLSAREIMIPRPQITAIPMNITFTGIIELSQKTRLSKFPVYKTSIDDIQGVLHVKDMMRFAQDRPSFSVKDCMRQPLFVLETRKMSSIQQILRDNNQTIAIVLDEYSGTAGLLTMEDIAQEIFGTMYDEYDSSVLPEIQRKSETEFLLSGNARLIDISEKTGVNLESKYYETIAGYINEKLDNLPEIGTVLKDENVNLTVLDMTDRRVLQVLLKKESV
jgi:CBS domain containing-hemolysin-like protein